MKKALFLFVLLTATYAFAVNTAYQITDATHDVVTPPGSRIGVGVLAATVMVDIRSDNTVAGDPGYTVGLWRNSQTAAGTREQIVRQRGTMGAPTATGVSDNIFAEFIYGVNSSNTLSQGGEFDIDQDQAAGAASTPLTYTWKAMDTGGTRRSLMHIDSAQHWNAPTSTAPGISACGGAGAAIVGSDTAGTVTIGAAGTGCVVTFNTNWTTVTPAFTVHCTVSSQTSLTWSYSYSSTAITIAAAAGAGDKFDYTCIGAS